MEMSTHASAFFNASGCTTLQLLNAVYKDALCPISASVASKRKCNKISLSPLSSSNDHLPESDLQVRRKSSSHSNGSFLRCNSDSSLTIIESNTQADDENERYRNFLCQYFRTVEPRQFRKTRHQTMPWLDNRFNKYYEHLSNGCIGFWGATKTLQSWRLAVAQQRVLKNACSEAYSRKVFVGGLPIDIDEDELISAFNRFGPLIVDWPNKTEGRHFSSAYYPPKGYVFLVFAHEYSVRLLCQACFVSEDKLLLYMSSSLSPEKVIQIRPWKLADADYVVQPNARINPRNAVFVGGVPRPIKAVELAHIMDRMYGPVACAGIDTDVDYKYPKGAGRVVFFNKNSFIKAISDRYVQLSHGEIQKRVELKPYVLDDQQCDECNGERSGNRSAPFFCPKLECLQYYCEECWTSMHSSQPDFEDHKPLIKEA
uniref:Cytoplasmic polyadenylation element-binding protein 1 n=1 Tax=Ditylenchus dipsaci TaxID=166011 RepID=A0A915CV73_9BILA